MYIFDTRYAALKAFPNAIVRKMLHHTCAGYYVFNNYTTYEKYKSFGYCR